MVIRGSYLLRFVSQWYIRIGLLTLLHSIRIMRDRIFVLTRREKIRQNNQSTRRKKKMFFFLFISCFPHHLNSFYGFPNHSFFFFRTRSSSTPMCQIAHRNENKQTHKHTQTLFHHMRSYKSFKHKTKTNQEITIL